MLCSIDVQKQQILKRRCESISTQLSYGSIGRYSRSHSEPEILRYRPTENASDYILTYAMEFGTWEKFQSFLFEIISSFSYMSLFFLLEDLQFRRMQYAGTGCINAPKARHLR